MTLSDFAPSVHTASSPRADRPSRNLPRAITSFPVWLLIISPVYLYVCLERKEGICQSRRNMAATSLSLGAAARCVLLNGKRQCAQALFNVDPIDGSRTFLAERWSCWRPNDPL